MLFAQNRPISGPSKFTPNLNEHSPKYLEIHLQWHRTRLREFGTIPGTYPNPTSLKPWAIAQDFCSKSADFGPFRIHPKSSPAIPTVVANPFGSTFARFQGVWNDSGTYPNPTSLKPWAIAQAFCSKSADFAPFRIHPESLQTIPKVVLNPFAST